jgi:signal transduction histidine kinase
MARQLAEPKGIRVKLKVEGRVRALPADAEYNLLQIAQEAILNAVNHSGTRLLIVAVGGTAKCFRLLIGDEGAGFIDGHAAEAGHYGLTGMRERAAHIGANLQVDTTPGCGTRVRLTLST